MHFKMEGPHSPRRMYLLRRGMWMGNAAVAKKYARATARAQLALPLPAVGQNLPTISRRTSSHSGGIYVGSVSTASIRPIGGRVECGQLECIQFVNTASAVSYVNTVRPTVLHAENLLQDDLFGQGLRFWCYCLAFLEPPNVTKIITAQVHHLHAHTE